MPNLSHISQLDESSLELLEVAGYADPESLAEADSSALFREIERANSILKLRQATPSPAEVSEWIAAACALTGAAAPAGAAGSSGEKEEVTVDYESRPDISAQLATAPCAIPLPGHHLKETGLAVAEIPQGILLNRYHGRFEIRGVSATRSTAPAAAAVVSRPSSTPLASRGKTESSGYVQLSDAPPLSTPAGKLSIDTTRVKNMEEYVAQPKAKFEIPQPAKDDERLTLLRSARESTNRGVDPKSRRFVRGVLHTHPGGIVLAAIITPLLILALPLAILAGALLLASDLWPFEFDWVPSWLLAFPLALPVLGLLYLMFGLNGACRICGQKLFRPKNCIKNSKAHHFPGLGNIIPMSLHILFFKWFRCTYCGTPVRVKK